MNRREQKARELVAKLDRNRLLRVGSQIDVFIEAMEWQAQVCADEFDNDSPQNYNYILNAGTEPTDEANNDN